MLIAILSLLAGIAIGYGFRGFISRTKDAAGKTILTDVKADAAKEVAKL